MKKLFIVLILNVPLVANAGLWEKLSTLNERLVKPTNIYNIEAPGWNLRAIEWTPADNPNVRCIFGGGSKKGGIACYEVSNEISRKQQTKED